MKALAIMTTGRSTFDLDEADVLGSLQASVGGYIEHIPFPLEGVTAFVNEEGKLQPGAACNVLATVMVQKYLAEGDYIAGRMVLVGLDEDGEATGLTPGQIAQVEALVGAVQSVR